MDKPRKPGNKASMGEWDRYHVEMAEWKVWRQNQQFVKYSSSETRDTGTPQTDLLFGQKGTKGGHIAVDDSGKLLHVRDADGIVLYDYNTDDDPYPGW